MDLVTSVAIDPALAAGGQSGDRIVHRRCFGLTSLAGALGGPVAAEAPPVPNVVAVDEAAFGKLDRSDVDQMLEKLDGDGRW